MGKRGFFAGGDYVPYQPGNLNYTTPTSRKEFEDHIRKVNSQKLRIKRKENSNKKNCPICNKSQSIYNSHCINCNYRFNTESLDKVIKTYENKPKTVTKDKPKIKLFSQEFSDNDLFVIIKESFDQSDYIKWDMECIPRTHSTKLNRFFNAHEQLCFSRLNIDKDESIYYFAFKKDRFPKLMLVFNQKTIKSNFKLFNDELLVLLKIDDDFNEIRKHFKLRYATKNKKSNLYYISLGNLNEDILSNIKLLVSEFSDSLSNPLLKNYEFYKPFNFNDLLD